MRRNAMMMGMFSFLRKIFKKERDFDKIIKPILPKLKAAGVRKLGFFGSYARGEERWGSDIDVLLELKPEAEHLQNLCDVGDTIEKFFHRKADIVFEEGMAPHWKEAILKTVKYVKIN
jgi:predicted nucleotidyltransferase